MEIKAKIMDQVLANAFWTRITSYNVCYTKLLRQGPGVFPVTAIPVIIGSPGCAAVIPRTIICGLVIGKRTANKDMVAQVHAVSEPGLIRTAAAVAFHDVNFLGLVIGKGPECIGSYNFV